MERVAMATPASSEADVLCEQGRALLKERKYPEALAIFESAVALDSRHIPAHEGAATSAFASRDFAKAAAHYKKVSVLDVRRAEPLINLGAVYNRMQDYANAARSLRQAISKDKKSATAYYNLGIAYKGQNQHSLAISAYKEAIRLDPKMPESHLNLGNVFLEMGNTQHAIQQFEKALELEPRFEKARKSLDKARQALEASRLSQNPFGRLVKEDDVARRQQAVVLPVLSPQERFDDRQFLHQLAKETENLSLAVIAQLQDELGPAVLRLQQVSAQSGEARALYREAQQTAAISARFSAVAAALHAKTEAIRLHEKDVRGGSPSGTDQPRVAAGVPT
jgi:tetratricopeptide (TPR) repeat protein